MRWSSSTVIGSRVRRPNKRVRKPLVTRCTKRMLHSRSANPHTPPAIDQPALIMFSDCVAVSSPWARNASVPFDSPAPAPNSSTSASSSANTASSRPLGGSPDTASTKGWKNGGKAIVASASAWPRSTWSVSTFAARGATSTGMKLTVINRNFSTNKRHAGLM